MKTVVWVLAIALGFVSISSTHDEFASFRRLMQEDEAALRGAGLFGNHECQSHATQCINGLSINGPCQNLGLEGVECIVSRVDTTCDNGWGWLDTCTRVVNANCPTGVIIKCRKVNGVTLWQNKGVGNASCGIYKVCL